MDQATRGAAALEAGDYAAAITHYTDALSIHPRSVDYFISRSTAYQRCTPPQHESALRDAETAVALAHERAVRELMAKAHMRQAISLFGLERWADAAESFAVVRGLDPKMKALEIWEGKAQSKLAEVKESKSERTATAKEDSAVVGEETPAAGDKSTSDPVPTATEQTQKESIKFTSVRHEWYQTTDRISFTVFAKGLTSENVQTDLQENSLSISFPIGENSSYDLTYDPLYAPIDPASSTVAVLKTKVEISLKKLQPGVKWHAMEGSTASAGEGSVSLSRSSDQSPQTQQPSSTSTSTSTAAAPSYPTSSRTGPKNWDKLASDLTKSNKSKDGGDKEGSDDEGDEVSGFFKNLYKNADADTRRAMVKSYQESNGTSLSTNWESVGKETVKTEPPEGMIAKKWGE